MVASSDFTGCAVVDTIVKRASLPCGAILSMVLFQCCRRKLGYVDSGRRTSSSLLVGGRLVGSTFSPIDSC